MTTKSLQILKFFPEPIFKYKFENFKNFNKELSKYIYDLKDRDNNGVIKSNKGGWHSKDFEFKKKDSIQNKFVIELQKYILNVFQNFSWKTENKKIEIQSMWAIINKKGDYNVIHTHPNCHLSAAYYVKAEKGCGRFQIEHPNIAKSHFYPEVIHKNELNILVAGNEIEEGDLLIFPSYLPHKVSENKSKQDRIVISFNVGVK